MAIYLLREQLEGAMIFFPKNFCGEIFIEKYFSTWKTKKYMTLQFLTSKIGTQISDFGYIFIFT